MNGIAGGVGSHGMPGKSELFCVTLSVEAVDGGGSTMYFGGVPHGGIWPATPALLKFGGDVAPGGVTPPRKPGVAIVGVGYVVVKIGNSWAGVGAVALPEPKLGG